MPRYFFHVYNGNEQICDNEGVECESIREMRMHMLHMAMTEVMAANPQKPVWSMEALDQRGVIVGSMDFGLLSSTDYRK